MVMLLSSKQLQVGRDREFLHCDYNFPSKNAANSSRPDVSLNQKYKENIYFQNIPQLLQHLSTSHYHPPFCTFFLNIKNELEMNDNTLYLLDDYYTDSRI